MRSLTLFLCLSGSLAAQPQMVETLAVEDVIESVRKRYPALLTALADREIADAEVLSAEGRFDTTMRLRFDADSFGYYENQRFDSTVERSLSYQGMSVYGGYRLGDGDFAAYDGKLATRSIGEFRTGLKLPLLRDRTIDSRRGELAKARIGKKLAELSVEQQRLAVLQSSISRYWNWVALGRRLAVAKEVLRTAETRQSLLEEGVRQGQLPAIEAVDNRRAILQRRSAAVEAERAFEQASIDLSLFYRDTAGEPVIPSVGQVPAQFPAAMPLDAAGLAADEQTALQRRPEIARLAAQGDQNDVDRRMAVNTAKPVVDIVSAFTYDSGSGAAIRRGPQEFKSGLSFEFPVQNRAARGKEQAAAAKGRQIDIRLRFLRDQVTAEVRDAFSAVRAAHDRLKLLSDEVQVSRDLEDAERARFELGDGTLFMLNLREQATMDAAIREALAQSDYQRARTAYEYATGALLDR